MTTDTALVYFGTAVRLAGLNHFYRRRVLQRWDRGEISAREAAGLLMAAAKRGDARIEFIDVRASNT